MQGTEQQQQDPPQLSLLLPLAHRLEEVELQQAHRRRLPAVSVLPPLPPGRPPLLLPLNPQLYSPGTPRPCLTLPTSFKPPSHPETSLFAILIDLPTQYLLLSHSLRVQTLLPPPSRRSSSPTLPERSKATGSPQQGLLPKSSPSSSLHGQVRTSTSSSSSSQSRPSLSRRSLQGASTSAVRRYGRATQGSSTGQNQAASNSPRRRNSSRSNHLLRLRASPPRRPQARWSNHLRVLLSVNFARSHFFFRTYLEQHRECEALWPLSGEILFDNIVAGRVQLEKARRNGEDVYVLTLTSRRPPKYVVTLKEPIQLFDEAGIPLDEMYTDRQGTEMDFARAERITEDALMMERGALVKRRLATVKRREEIDAGPVTSFGQTTSNSLIYEAAHW